MKNFVQLLLVGLSAWVLAACETVEGAGEDLENVGEEISDTARDNK